MPRTSEAGGIRGALTFNRRTGYLNCVWLADDDRSSPQRERRRKHGRLGDRSSVCCARHGGRRTIVSFQIGLPCRSTHAATWFPRPRPSNSFSHIAEKELLLASLDAYARTHVRVRVVAVWFGVIMIMIDVDVC